MKNRELAEKRILKHRTDLDIDSIKMLSDLQISQENKRVSRYETGKICRFGIPKDISFEQSVREGKIHVFSFPNWVEFSRRCTYMEYLYCLENDLIPKGWY